MMTGRSCLRSPIERRERPHRAPGVIARNVKQQKLRFASVPSPLPGDRRHTYRRDSVSPAPGLTERYQTCVSIFPTKAGRLRAHWTRYPDHPREARRFDPESHFSCRRQDIRYGLGSPGRAAAALGSSTVPQNSQGYCRSIRERGAVTAALRPSRSICRAPTKMFFVE
jgi:hypothetical protein